MPEPSCLLCVLRPSFAAAINFLHKAVAYNAALDELLAQQAITPEWAASRRQTIR
jgi:hypothetical protein